MIYYVEDDINICELALYALRQSGFDAEGFANAAAFRAACLSRKPDLVLLDIMLPDEDGIAILEWIRKSPDLSAVPVMMLTAKGTEYDKVCGLDAGADDYLAKPFGMMELVSRCNALLRRASRLSSSGDSGQGELAVGDIVLSPSARQVLAGGVEVELTLKEFDLLQALAESPGRVFTRAQLLESVWGITFVGETRTVDTHIQTLRRKLNDACPGSGDAIQTVRGVGYRIARDS